MTRAGYTIAEAAQMLGGLHPRTIRKAIEEGTIPHFRIGPKRILIPAEFIENLAKGVAA